MELSNKKFIMGNVIDAIYRYFADEKVALSTKVKLSILVLLAIFLVDNHYGFSHTVINSYKVDYMVKLEEAKQKYKDDISFVKKIDRLIEIEHSRKGVVQKFYSLITPKVDEKQLGQSDNIYKKLMEERDPIVHTMTGAFVTLIPMLSGMIAILLSLFRPSQRSIDVFFMATITILVCGCMTYYISLSWAMLDPICGKVWVNYIIQALVNIVILIVVVSCIEASGHKVDAKEDEIEEIEAP